MNKADLQQAGGFPLETDTLDFMQKAYTELMAMTAFGGDNVIVSGCNVVGSNVSDGYVVINGELLPFKGGIAQTKVVIKEDKTSMVFENGSNKEVYFVRYATFGNSLPNTLFSDLTRLSSLKTLSTLEARIAKLEVFAAPFSAGGGMVLWRRPLADIPAGWREVVEWRSRVPFGWHPDVPMFNEVAKNGGSLNKVLSSENMPEHYHMTVVEQDINTDTFPGTAGRVVSAVRSMIRSWFKPGGSGRESYHMYGQSGTFPNQQPNISPTSKAGAANPTAVDIVNQFRTVMYIEPIPIP